jgi:hypothetical protein
MIDETMGIQTTTTTNTSRAPRTIWNMKDFVLLSFEASRLTRCPFQWHCYLSWLLFINIGIVSFSSWSCYLLLLISYCIEEVLQELRASKHLCRRRW